MFSSPFQRLLAVSTCIRVSDQLVVAAVPLVAAAVFRLPEDQVGAMIAAQGAAWLLMSLPAGVFIDRIAPLEGVKRAVLISLLGVCVLLAGLFMQLPVLFAFGSFLSASAAVLGLLADGASLQRLLKGSELGQGNARLQIIQSCAMLIGPFAMGWLVAKGFTQSALIMVGLFLLIGLALARGFPAQDSPPPRESAPMKEIAEGLHFVRQQPLLRGIVVCALFWNLAFMALTAIFVPFALKRLAMGTADIGMAQSAIGLGSLAAALTAGWIMKNVPPRFLLFFGPASSTLAACLLLMASSTNALPLTVVTYFMFGYGPILWLVCQNTIRQLVTPAGMLGRVGAVIQLSLYGMRSVGALIGGKVALLYGFDAVLWLIVGLFALSTLAIPLSALGGLSAMPRSAGSQA